MTALEKAISYAVNAHAGMKRKGKERPYILHPVEAMTIVAGLTDDEEVIAAAVLHDTVEDTDASREDIEAAFGPRIADLVAAESEDKRGELPAEDTWQIRKQETLDHLAKASREIKLICLGDKLSNIREIARDYASLGDELWQRFNQKDKAKHAWYYGSIHHILEREFGEVPAVAEYRSLLQQVFGNAQ